MSRETMPHLNFQNPGIYLYGPGDARLEDSPMPQITNPHDVIVRIACVGVCGSDVRQSRVTMHVLEKAKERDTGTFLDARWHRQRESLTSKSAYPRPRSKRHHPLNRFRGDHTGYR